MPNSSAKLLIIDDDCRVRASLADYLEDSGFQVLQAAGALAGLELFDLHHPDLVISDLRMPQMDGLELVRRINRRCPDLPVIIVSGAGVMADAVEALRLGAVDYLIKPIEDLAVLEHAVRRALERQRLQQENLRYREQLEAANRGLQASLQLLQEDQDAARQVQANMFPPTPWEAGGFCFAHKVIPSLYLSGDFVDYFWIDEHRLGFYLADVSGHGASSAFVTVLLKFMTTRLLYESKRSGPLPAFRPSDVLAHLNRGLIACNLGKHVTMLGGVIDLSTQQLHYSIGGHLPLPILFADQKACYLSGKGLPVGIFEGATYENHTLSLPNAFSLGLFSDGIFDLLVGDSLEEKEQFLQSVMAQAGGSLEPLKQILGLPAAKDMPDDIALLVLTRNIP